MRHLSLSAAILLTAVIFGCGPGKELPSEVRTKQVSGPGDDPNGKAPAASDPAAKAVIERAVNAISENDPARLAKGKVAKVTYQAGQIKLGQGSAWTKAESTIETVWPDSARVVTQLKDVPADFPGKTTTTFYLKGRHGWMKGGDTLLEHPPEDMAQRIRTELLAWHWPSLGLPFAEPNAIVFSPTKTEKTTTVKLALPDFPVFLLTFDNGSGLLMESVVHPIENQRRVRKAFKMTGHMPTNGLLLPTRIEYFEKDDLILHWEKPTWEFPASIDPAHFELPK